MNVQPKAGQGILNHINDAETKKQQKQDSGKYLRRPHKVKKLLSRNSQLGERGSTNAIHWRKLCFTDSPGFIVLLLLKETAALRRSTKRRNLISAEGKRISWMENKRNFRPDFVRLWVKGKKWNWLKLSRHENIIEIYRTGEDERVRMKGKPAENEHSP